MTMRTVENYVRDGLAAYTVDGSAYVRVDELLPMWREKRL